MRIVTTPMCEEIVKYAGIKKYNIKKFPQKNDGDLAIILSETHTDLENIKIKINTFKQIQNSIEEISKYTKNTPRHVSENCPIAMKYLNNTTHQNTTKIKIYSHFLKDIAIDMGFQIVDKNPDYIVAPDYLENKINENTTAIIIPSHNNITLNPIKKAAIRYKILEEYI